MADKYSISPVTLPLTTLRLGLSKKPYIFVLAYTESEFINPIFGPSGVSIGHTRP